MTGGAPRELTVKEFALLERVTERTVRRWLDKGAITCRRTPGGGIRILDYRRADTVGPHTPHRRRTDDP